MTITIQRIALHYSNLELGGLQRVICLQLKEFTNRNIHILLLLDRPLPEQHYSIPDRLEIQIIPRDRHIGEAKRTAQLLDALRAFKPDVYYDHDYLSFVQSPKWLTIEWQAIKRVLNIPVFLHWHNVFARFFYLNGTIQFMAILKQMESVLDGIIVLSRADCAFFNSRGFRAFYVPNPIDD